MTMTRNLGDSLHRKNKVRVNQINPGWVLTEKEIERKKNHGLKLFSWSNCCCVANEKNILCIRP